MGAWRNNRYLLSDACPFLHVFDAVRAIVPTNQITQRVFNVVGKNYQKRRLIELALRHFPQSDIIVTEKNPDPRDLKVDSSRIQRHLGFGPRYTVEDVFSETAQAVMQGVFCDPNWAGHSAIPLDRASFGWQ